MSKFRGYSVTEQPYKIPYYAALLRSLYNPPEMAESDSPVLGRQILEDFWKGFQGYLDKVAWRETRQCVSVHHLF
jgi:nuclear cap-binding protein subunit 1